MISFTSLAFKAESYTFETSDDMMTNTSEIQPIKRQSLADEVAVRIREEIKSGKYKVGQQLPPEPELMRYYGVGRSSVREAIRILANTGVLRVQQGSGTFVEPQQPIAEPLHKRLERAKSHELNEVRQLIELKIAEKAAQYRTKKDIERMKHFLKLRHEAAKANDTERSIDADVNFHIAVAEASRSEILCDLFRSFASQIRKSFQAVYIDTEAFLQTQSMHESLLHSIEKQDGKKAWYWAEKITNHAK